MGDTRDCAAVGVEIPSGSLSVEGSRGSSYLLCNFAVTFSGKLLFKVVLFYQEPVEINDLGFFWCILCLLGKGGREEVTPSIRLV